MREGFEYQTRAGIIPIKEVKIPSNTNSHMAALMAALQYIFITPEWNERIETLLSAKVLEGKIETGRMGMSLWEVFVLCQVRLCMKLTYDELHHMANYDLMLRGILGVLPIDVLSGIQYEYQTLYDNTHLLDDESLKEINDLIVAVGHEVFKKKESDALRLKTDSYVIETDTHFPTDYNLLWDSARKCLDTAIFLRKKGNLQGWRKASNWKRTLKNLGREIGRINSLGGKNKTSRLKETVNNYLDKARGLASKVEQALNNLIVLTMDLFPKLIEMEYYLTMLNKHIDLVERRLIKGETIPHKEKVFSIFQPYAEWITKGKLHPNVEIGKKLFVTTDQCHLIVDYQIGDHQADNQLTLEIAARLLAKYIIQSLSVDKGFSDMADKDLLELFIPQVVMPKKGKRNQKEKEIESNPAFKKLKKQHSAIESNINELEHRGLDKCPDRNYKNFKRYIGLGVCAYNLHKIGRKLLKEQQREEREALKQAA